MVVDGSAAVRRPGADPIAEAVTYRNLMRQPGRTQTGVARLCGCTQSHVSRRLALLGLPAAAQQAVRDGSLPVRDAEDLCRLPAELVMSVLEQVRSGAVAVAAVRRAHDLWVLSVDRQAAVDTLRSHGVRVIGPRNGRLPRWNPVRGPVLLTDLPWVDQAEHRRLRCHAALVPDFPRAGVSGPTAVDRWVWPVCTDPAAHPMPNPGPPSLPALAVGGATV